MAIKVYVFGLVLGGILLAASMVAGDGATEPGGEPGAGDLDPSGAGHGDLAGIATTLLSLRFWTFFSAFFGLSGLVLDGLGIIESPWLAMVLSVAVGLGIGYVASAIWRFAVRDEVGLAASSDDYVGKVARVLLPFERGEVGKLRLELRGTSVDVLARSDDEDAIRAGDEVRIVAMEGSTALVTRQRR
jgi:membrane protein implicated in regulation of membrane protease activity